MADDNREIGIKVTTSADLAALKQTSQEARRVEQGVKQVAQAQNTTAKSAETAASSGSKFKDALRGIAFELPGVARFIGFLANPLTLVSAGLGIVAGKLLEVKKKADDALALQGRINSVGDSVMSIARRATDFAAKAEEFERGLKKIGTASTNAAAQFEKLNTQLERAKQLQDELTDLTAELEQKKLAFQVGDGEPGELADGLAQIRQQAMKEKAEREEYTLRAQASQAAFAARKTMVDVDAARARKPNPETLARLQSEYDVAKEVATTKGSDFSQFSEKANTELEKLKKLRATQIKYFSGGDASQAQTQEVMATTDRMRKLMDELKTRRKENEAVQAKSDAAEQALKKAQAAASQSDADVTAGTQKATELNRQAEDLFQQYKTRREHNRKVLGIRTEIDDVDAATIQKRHEEQLQKERDREAEQKGKEAERTRRQQQRKNNRAMEDDDFSASGEALRGGRGSGPPPKQPGKGSVIRPYKSDRQRAEDEAKLYFKQHEDWERRQSAGQTTSRASAPNAGEVAEIADSGERVADTLGQILTQVTENNAAMLAAMSSFRDALDVQSQRIDELNIS